MNRNFMIPLPTLESKVERNGQTIVRVSGTIVARIHSEEPVKDAIPRILAGIQAMLEEQAKKEVGKSKV